jgi:hypothetical protein
MTYRDDLEAAQLQIEKLKQELEDVKRDKLVHEAPPVPPVLTPREVKPIGGTLYYDPPRSYFPLLPLVRAAALAAWHRMPTAPTATSNSVLVILGNRLLWSFVNFVWRPVYVACLLLLVLPYVGALAVVVSIPLLPVIVVARLRVGPRPPEAGGGWPQGEASEQEGAMALWMFLCFAGAPLLFVFLPLLDEKSDA